MTDLNPFLKELIKTPGLSGYETPIRQMLEEHWTPLTDELSISRIGSLHGLKRGNLPEPRPSILLAAHMDTIGLMVTKVTGGFLRVTEVGGLDPRILPGQPVIVHGRQDLPGLIVQPPPRLLPAQAQNGPVPLEYLLVDIGLPEEEVSRLVRSGDLVSFAQPPLETGGETLTSPYLDNRVSIATLTQCLQELQHRPHAWDVWAVATVQEEETLGGAATSAFQLHPTLAVAIDVTFGDSPGSPSHRTYPLGKGPALGWGPNIHPYLYNAFKELAERLEMPYQTEVMPRLSGTDAVTLQITAQGIPTMVLSIPVRYMHTPVEMVAIKDIRRAGRLLAEFIAQLSPNFMDEISWDEPGIETNKQATAAQALTRLPDDE
jgi:putative aminopeptidase FrvX